MTRGPIIVTGADRSGTTLLFGLIGSHPDVTMVRRTNLWRWFDGRYGDLTAETAVRKLVDDLSRYPRLGVLSADWDSVLTRSLAEPMRSYGSVFRLPFEDLAKANGTSRWGDKSLHLEHNVDRILDVWPDASVVQVVRDPRDRYASVSRRYGGRPKGIASITGRWLDSVAACQSNVDRHPDRCLLVRYEDVATNPTDALSDICRLTGLDYDQKMLTLSAMHRQTDKTGNSSFESIPAGTISTSSIGRYRNVLTPEEIASLETICRSAMDRLGYERSGIRPEGASLFVWGLSKLPVEAARVAAWRRRNRRILETGEPIPEGRLVDPAV